jgi:DNA-binding NarL/FixJ family response regulator
LAAIERGWSDNAVPVDLPSRRPSISVVLVEPLQARTTGLAEVLAGSPGIEIAATSHDAPSAVLQADRSGASVVVVAASLNGSLARVCHGVHALPRRPRVLLIDGEPDEGALLASIEAGTNGYVTRGCPPTEIAEAIRTVAHGGSVVPPAMLGSLLRTLIDRQRRAAHAAGRLAELTPREREVLSLLVEGQDASGIAAALVISPETARTHIQRILRKLGVHSRAEAIALIDASGLGRELSSMTGRGPA